MSVSALLVRFTLIYVAMLIVIAVALHLFGIEVNSGVNIGALIGAVMWACFSFARKNDRYFSNEEKTRVVLGMLAIDVILQLVLSVFVLSAGAAELTMGPILFATAFVGLIHAAVIYFFVGFAGKQYAKQASKGG